jgi:hypothetical protein
MEVEAHLPDGQTTPLIRIPDWDFNWQGGYRYQVPVHLPKGTRIELEYTYDNSAGNPRNPSNPPAHAQFGEQTTDEMAVAFFTVVLPSPTDVAPFRRDIRLAVLDDMLASGDLTALNRLPGMGGRGQQLLQRFDTNGDGKLDDTERAALMDFLRAMMR